MLQIYLLFALDMINLSLFIPIFGRHILHLGGSHMFLGLIGSCSAFISFFWKPIAGSLSDTKGARKILIWCLTLCLFGNIITCWSKSLYITFFARLLCAFGSPTQTLLKTTLTDLVEKKEEISEIFNKIGMLFATCFIGGALVSGFISEYENGFYYIFIIISANTIINIANSLPKAKISKANEKKKFQSVQMELKTVLSSFKHVDWNHYWDVFTVKAVLELSYGVMQTNMGLVLLKVFNAEGRIMGFMLTIIGIASIFTNAIMIKLNKTVYANDNGYTRIFHGSSLLILSYFGLGLSPLVSIFLFFIFIMSVSRALLDSSLNDVLNSKVNANDKGKMMSMFDSIFSLAELISPILSSVIASIYGFQFTIILCTLPVFIVTTVAYTQKKIKNN